VPAGGFGSQASLKALGFKSYNEKLNIACIGLGMRGPQILPGAAASENIVALCDVDETRGAPTVAQYPKANRYQDYRKMLDGEGKLAVSYTPDLKQYPTSQELSVEASISDPSMQEVSASDDVIVFETSYNAVNSSILVLRLFSRSCTESRRSSQRPQWEVSSRNAEDGGPVQDCELTCM
jgi:hypothetical protein